MTVTEAVKAAVVELFDANQTERGWVKLRLTCHIHAACYAVRNRDNCESLQKPYAMQNMIGTATNKRNCGKN